MVLGRVCSSYGVRGCERRVWGLSLLRRWCDGEGLGLICCVCRYYDD